MSFDKNDLDKILSLSPEEFQKKLSNAVKNSGLDPIISAKLLKDTDKIRNALSGIGEKELLEASKIIKKNNLEHFETIIKNEINKRG